jgi:hypothetical protein
MTVRIETRGLAEASRYMDLAPRATTTSVRIAINQVAQRSGIRTLREAMEEEVAFPKGYLNDQRRFGVTQLASDANLEAKITARSRPTSLARFASGAAPVGDRRNSAVSVRVNPGRRRALSQAFLIRLRAGEGPVTDDSFNLGLAIRLRPGERISNKTRMVPFGGGLYLLYGPSVDQVFRDVAVNNAEEVADLVAAEFFRQLDLRLSGRV